MEGWPQMRESWNNTEEETLRMVEKRYEQSKNLGTNYKL